jgi:hypothetical protein
MSKKMMSMLLTLLLTGITFFGLGDFWFFHWDDWCFPCTPCAYFRERLSKLCHGLCGTFPKICAKFDTVPLSNHSRNHTRPDTRPQIKGRKNQHVHSAAWNFVQLSYASTIIYRCNALLQLLYIWQYQSRKLWMAAHFSFRLNMTL